MSFTLPLVTGFNIDLFLLVFMRMSGLFIFSPVLGRENIPLILRATIGLLCALVVMPTLTGVSAHVNGAVELIVQSLGELFIGLSLGILVSIIIYIVVLAGELIDMQMGLTMAQMYDARSGINMPILGSFFNILVILVFFSSNAHLYLLSFVNDSFHLIAPGMVMPTQQSLKFLTALGSDYFEFGLRMALPIVAIEVVCHIAQGMIMRAVPSINIFSVGMFISMLVGLLIVLITMTAIVTMCGQLVSFLTEKAAETIKLIAT